MKRKINSSVLSFLLVITAMFFAAACNNNGQTSTESTPGENMESQENSNSNQTATPRVDTVVINMMKFNPENIHVNKGDTIVWINKGIVAHDVSEFPGKTWTSDTIARGASWKKVIDKGFDYFCSIHITMKGKVTVNP